MYISILLLTLYLSSPSRSLVSTLSPPFPLSLQKRGMVRDRRIVKEEEMMSKEWLAGLRKEKKRSDRGGEEKKDRGFIATCYLFSEVNFRGIYNYKEKLGTVLKGASSPLVSKFVFPLLNNRS